MTPQDEARVLEIALEVGAHYIRGEVTPSYQFKREELFDFAQRIQDEQKRRDAEIVRSHMIERGWEHFAKHLYNLLEPATSKDKP